MALAKEIMEVPQPTGEVKRVIRVDDTEGHLAKVKLAPAGEDDVEGHKHTNR